MENKIELCKLECGSYKIEDYLSLDKLKEEDIAWDSEWAVPVRIIKYPDLNGFRIVVLAHPIVYETSNSKIWECRKSIKYQGINQTSPYGRLANKYDESDIFRGFHDLRFKKMTPYRLSSYRFDQLDVFGQLRALYDYAASCIDLVDQIEELDLSALILDLNRLKHDIRYDAFGNRIEP